MSPILTLAAAIGIQALAPADTTLASLQAEIARLAEEVDGEVGAAVIHLESGRGVATHGDARFFLASVYKLPIAIALLRHVDAGSIGLGDTIRLEPWDFRLGRATLAPNDPQGGGAYTVEELLASTISDSDNSASDALLRIAGGAAAVTDTLRTLGIDGIRIDRGEGQSLLEYYGIGDSFPETERTPARVRARLEASPPAARAAAQARFAAGSKDTGSALAVAEVLERLWRGELLSPASTRLLLDKLRDGWIVTRIVAGLPPGTPVWHKTGSYGAVATHDAGIVEIPDGTHLAIVVLVRQDTRDEAAAERAIAAITRAAWEFWAVPTLPAEGRSDPP